jgi:hypothetical protein
MFFFGHFLSCKFMEVSENLYSAGIIKEKKEEDDDDDYPENKHRTVRSSVNADSDSD